MTRIEKTNLAAYNAKTIDTLVDCITMLQSRIADGPGDYLDEYTAALNAVGDLLSAVE